jgi:hypothetical protein
VYSPSNAPALSVTLGVLLSSNQHISHLLSDQMLLLLFFAAVYSPSNAPALSVTLGVLQLLANHYPERLYKAYVVNAPSIFQMAWKVREIVFILKRLSCRMSPRLQQTRHCVKPHVTRSWPKICALHKAYVVNAPSIFQMAWKVREGFHVQTFSMAGSGVRTRILLVIGLHFKQCTYVVNAPSIFRWHGR